MCTRKILPTLMLMLLCGMAQAQYTPGRELTSDEVERRADADTSQWQVHGSIFAGFYSGFGTACLYNGVAPTLTSQANDNLWLSGTLFFVGGHTPSALLPYRDGHGPVEPMFVPGQAGLLAYGASLSLRYRTRRDNYLDFHFTYVNDRSGLMTPMCLSPFSPMGMHYNAFWGW